MDITNSSKEIDMAQIDCSGSLKVTLALSAAPDISSNPADIVLVLDRSGSMAGSPLANMKAGADTFIDIIDEATDGAGDGTIGSGSRIGIVSFANTATADTQLITSVADLKDAVAALTAGGSTNHADAFTTTVSLFDPLSPNAKVIVMFTDGKTTAGEPPAPVAAAARAAGVIIYCIGLIGADGIDVSVLNDWATDPDASLRWEIPSLGVTGNEGTSLEFYIRHTAPTEGTKLVNQAITYEDTEGNAVTFPAPSVEVNCGIIVNPEPCPAPVDITVESCQDSLTADLGNTYMESLGRIVQLDVTVKNVCPGKRVALGIILTETDRNGQEHARGMKAITIPAHNAPSCRDVTVKCVRFVLPEDLNVSGGSACSLCSQRNLKVRLIAHNIDTDFQCCGTLTATLQP